MRIAINGNRHQEGHLADIDRLVTALVARGDTVVMAQPFLDYLCDKLGPRFAAGLEECPLTRAPHADLAVSIGGDGAFLKTARWVGESTTPVAGINTGHLGYLSAYSFDDPTAIERGILEGDFLTEERSLLEVTLADGQRLYALNEAALSRGDEASMLTAHVTVDGADGLTYLGDGLIISTPTGSTAYNLSVGGPILDPRLRGLVISPIAAHSLAVRPLVVADSSEIAVEASVRGREVRLSLDGRNIGLPSPARVKMRRAPHSLLIVRHPGTSFIHTLATKLGLNQ